MTKSPAGWLPWKKGVSSVSNARNRVRDYFFSYLNNDDGGEDNDRPYVALILYFVTFVNAYKWPRCDSVSVYVLLIFLYFTARRSYASAVLCVVILSVCPPTRSSVCPFVCLSHACISTKSNNALRIFWYRTPTVIDKRRPFRLKFTSKVTHPLRKRKTSTDLTRRAVSMP